jgi:hypothetical protein
MNAPKRIYLVSWNGKPASALCDLTWSEWDDAGDGVEYVRADLCGGLEKREPVSAQVRTFKRCSDCPPNDKRAGRCETCDGGEPGEGRPSHSDQGRKG